MQLQLLFSANHSASIAPSDMRVQTRDRRSCRVTVPRSVSCPGFALPRSLICQHLRSASSQPGSCQRFTELDEDPLRLRQAPCVLAEQCVSFGLGRKGLLLLHLGGLVPGCGTSGPCTESVTAGADGCPSRSGSEDGRVTARHEKKSNCRVVSLPSRADQHPPDQFTRSRCRRSLHRQQ